jgi:hypothetical protein
MRQSDASIVARKRVTSVEPRDAAMDQQPIRSRSPLDGDPI